MVLRSTQLNAPGEDLPICSTFSLSDAGHAPTGKASLGRRVTARFPSDPGVARP